MKSFLQTHAWASFLTSLGKKVCEEPVAIKMPIAWGFYYWYLPRIRQEEMKSFDWKITKDPKCVFVKIEPEDFLPDLGVLKKNSWSLQPKSSLVIDLKNTEEALLEAMHQKTRYNIRLAMRHGVEVRNMEKKDWEAGAELICKTAARQKYKDHGKEYYLRLMTFFGKSEGEIECSMTGAFHEGNLLAVGIFLKHGETVTYLFGGSSENQKNLMAPYLLHWQKIKEARLGARWYDFWGLETGRGKSAGFARFKEGFGGKKIEYPKTQDIILRPVWYNVYWSLKGILGFTRSLLRKM